MKRELVYVYLIERTDGKLYIGITINPKQRLRNHLKTKRFEQGINDFIILCTCFDYDYAEKLEEEFISKYDTYYNGLNKSINGKGNHLSSNFNTKGYKFTEAQRENLRKNHWSKKGYTPWNLGKHLSEETKKKLSKAKTGYYYGKLNFTWEDVKYIRDFYNNNQRLPEDFLISAVKKTQRENIKNLSFNEMISPNGRPLEYKTLVTKYFMKKYKAARKTILDIIENKTYNDSIKYQI
jgi:predicted GIY-YIG superfamily endonuclease